MSIQDIDVSICGESFPAESDVTVVRRVYAPGEEATVEVVFEGPISAYKGGLGCFENEDGSVVVREVILNS